MLLTMMVPPIAGVLVSDYWIARSYRRDSRSTFNARGIAAWAAGAGSMLIVTHPLRSVLGIVVSAAIYFVFQRLRPVKAIRATV